jgi:hypothetical protein
MNRTPNTTRLAGERIDGYLLGEWLEDSSEYDNLSRYEALYDGDRSMVEESVWVCMECDHTQDNCECVEYEDWV